MTKLFAVAQQLLIRFRVGRHGEKPRTVLRPARRRGARSAPAAVTLALREPKYQETAAYCHFGREPYTADGKKFFEWENAKDVKKYASMGSAEVSAALKASNYLTKWVD